MNKYEELAEKLLVVSAEIIKDDYAAEMRKLMKTLTPTHIGELRKRVAELRPLELLDEDVILATMYIMYRHP